jgi:hypothetical protein
LQFGPGEVFETDSLIGQRRQTKEEGSETEEKLRQAASQETHGLRV